MSITDSKKPVSDTHDRKTGLSCAECRRSKLKCDRVFPCQSCVRRGCANICPNGTLAATKGNKVLMAHAEKLSVQVKTLTKRVHELERALEAKQTSSSRSTPNSVEYCSSGEASDDADSASETMGTLSIGLGGQIKYHGTSAVSECLHGLLLPGEVWPPKAPKVYCLPVEIIELMNSFPLGIDESGFSRHLFLPFLPQRERALELSELYYRRVTWMYNPITKDDFITNVLNPIYGRGVINLEGVHSHALSVFFVVLANGVMHDMMLPEKQAFSNQYLALSRAALSLHSIIEEATCTTIQALFLIIQYDYHFDRTGAEERWLLHGLCTRMVLRIGLQRDCSGLNLAPEEIQRRRHLFWEVYMYDGWTSLANGRPPSFNLQHVDCRFPEESQPHIDTNGEKQLDYRGWMHRHAAACLSATNQLMFSAKPPPYQAFIALDEKIRQYPVPPYLQTPALAPDTPQTRVTNAVTAIQQYCITLTREANLLFLHRSYFNRAIRESPEDPVKHKFSHSVLSTYRSACRIVTCLRGLYEVHKDDATSCWFFWSSIFSACLIFGALAVECPRSSLASAALDELEKSLPFYEEGSLATRPPATLLTLKTLHRRAQEALRTGAVGPHLGKPKDVAQPDDPGVLEGRKSVMQERDNSRSPSLPSNGFDPRASPNWGLLQSESSIDFYRTFGNPLLEANYQAFNAPGSELSGAHNVHRTHSVLVDDMQPEPLNEGQIHHRIHDSAFHSTYGFAQNAHLEAEWSWPYVDVDQAFLRNHTPDPRASQMDGVLPLACSAIQQADQLH